MARGNSLFAPVRGATEGLVNPRNRAVLGGTETRPSNRQVDDDQEQTSVAPRQVLPSGLERLGLLQSPRNLPYWKGAANCRRDNRVDLRAVRAATDRS
jgi:hypothetical protein